jgi:putative Holliday junction resolvase
MPELAAHAARIEHLMRGTVLGFDFGAKRTGVAVGDLETGIAHALDVIRTEAKQARLDAIAALLREWRPVALLVGVPFHPDGAEHEMTRAARNFAVALEARFGLPVHLVDERYSSVAADADLREAGVRDWRERAKLIDAQAARTLLQSWLDEHGRAHEHD